MLDLTSERSRRRSVAAVLAGAVATAALVFFFVVARAPVGAPPPPAPAPIAESGAPPAPPAVATRAGAAAAARGAAPAPAPGEAHPRAPRPPAELVLLDGSTGLAIRTEPVTLPLSGKAPPAAELRPFVAEDGAFAFSGCVSPFAKRVRLTAVVWPELDLTVRIRNADGSVPAAPKIVRVRAAGETPKFEATPIGASGEFRIRGIAFRREESVIVTAADADRLKDSEAMVGGLAGREPGARMQLSVVLGGPGHPTVKDTVVEDHVETDNDLPFEEQPVRKDGGKGPGLCARVLRADGSPAAGVSVIVYEVETDGTVGSWGIQEATTDAHGLARIPATRVRPLALAVRTCGFLAGPPVIATPSRDYPRIVLHEAPGADVDVVVVDGQGRALPGAEVGVGVENWTWLENGVQRCGLFTDADGAIHLPRLPQGEVRIWASYGARFQSVVVRPPDSVVIRLAWPEAPSPPKPETVHGSGD